MLDVPEGQKVLLHFDMALEPETVLRAFSDIGDVANRLGIARALGCAKSPHLIGKINQCVDYGWLDVHVLRLPNGVDMFLYTLTDAGWQTSVSYAKR
jgi:hypothetical protein